MINLVEARNIDEVHFKLVRLLLQKGRIYIVDHGSYKDHKRLEFSNIVLNIFNPGERPLAPVLPQSIPSTIDEEAIQDYFVNYLMNRDVKENEEYTYGQYIVPQVDDIIKMFKEKGFNTNQAIITIGDIYSTRLKDPPCLRIIDCKIEDNKLHFYLYFRSWDLWGALPLNLGGLQLLKEYIACEIGVDDGMIYIMSKGLHIYDSSWPYVLLRLNSVLPENFIITKEELELGEGWMKK